MGAFRGARPLLQAHIHHRHQPVDDPDEDDGAAHVGGPTGHRVDQVGAVGGLEVAEERGQGRIDAVDPDEEGEGLVEGFQGEVDPPVLFPRRFQPLQPSAQQRTHQPLEDHHPKEEPGADHELQPADAVGNLRIHHLPSGGTPFR